ncbi:hypothetical protein MAHJHV58_13810 [Mycobacterium avium subsp. hominissuis]|nr:MULTISPECIES: PPE family protein [Mycobacterium avium complex (MAC)]ETZ58219.1 PPE family protein [Mycobacterium sp. MAC_011194_8550]MCA4728860.1 PPE family protein [Mycobacterium avium subsp. hominissuis]MDO2358741.1 PPE family protein [Mycobacterium avium subsp. hominissuis]QXD04716.1 PPE family protein [Mycobacterium avium subsp. hominissuis]UBV03934.1 PPE family protein [Mycobacterium avium subsp. hominissuis]
MDFATLPPEVSSGLMHSGPGAGSLIRAAAAWNGLARQLRAAATSYRAATAVLGDAAARYIDWLDGNAARGEQAAEGLTAAADAHRSACAAMVPPPVIAGNRRHRLALVSANCLGQHSPAIAEVDTAYERMWARNAAAMYAYADASAAAVTLTPFTAPPGACGAATRSWALAAAPELISAGGQVMAAIPDALEQLSVAPLRTLDAAMSPVTPALSKLNSLTAPSDLAIGHLNSMNKAAALQTLFPGPAAAPRVCAVVGRAMTVGVLSAPQGAAALAPLARQPRPDRAGEHIRLVPPGEPAGPHAAGESGG